MKQVMVKGYVRMFTATVVTVPDDFDIDDSEAVHVAWEEQRNLNQDAIEYLELSLDPEELPE